MLSIHRILENNLLWSLNFLGIASLMTVNVQTLLCVATVNIQLYSILLYTTPTVLVA